MLHLCFIKSTIFKTLGNEYLCTFLMLKMEEKEDELSTSHN